MPAVSPNVDWSATAAWIALTISIVGTIASPLITTWLTNQNQLKLHKLNLQHNYLEKYEDRRFQAINSFLQKIGATLTRFGIKELVESGSVFYGVYQYVPQELWPKLDQLYEALIKEEWDTAIQLYPPIAHKLSEILKEPPQLNP